MARATRYKKPVKMPKTTAPSYMLRAEDISAMIADGSIDSKYFLIRLIPGNIEQSNARLSGDRKTG